MKPGPFQYVVPSSVAEVLDHLAGSDGGAKILAGGQSLMPMMNFRPRDRATGRHQQSRCAVLHANIEEMPFTSAP